MVEMARILPRGACPICAHKQFVVIHSEINTYLTDGDGSIVDSRENRNKAVGKCVNCGNKFSMLVTPTGFIPMTKLRELFFFYSPHFEIPDAVDVDLKNPMELAL